MYSVAVLPLGSHVLELVEKLSEPASLVASLSPMTLLNDELQSELAPSLSLVCSGSETNPSCGPDKSLIKPASHAKLSKDLHMCEIGSMLIVQLP